MSSVMQTGGSVEGVVGNIIQETDEKDSEEVWRRVARAIDQTMRVSVERENVATVANMEKYGSEENIDGEHTHTVAFIEKEWVVHAVHCNCPDSRYRDYTCKHRWKVQLLANQFRPIFESVQKYRLTVEVTPEEMKVVRDGLKGFPSRLFSAIDDYEFNAVHRPDEIVIVDAGNNPFSIAATIPD